MDTHKRLNLTNVYLLWLGVFFIWSLYRIFFKNPEWIDELIVKPVVFLLPVFYSLFFLERTTLESIGIIVKTLPRDFAIGLGFGVVFTAIGLVANYVKYGAISLNPVVPLTGMGLFLTMFISIVTGFTEELLIRGFLYTRLTHAYQDKFRGLVVSSLMYLVMLLPIAFLRLQLGASLFLFFVMSNIILSVANTMLFSETKSITLPTLVHAFWNLAVILYI